MHFTGARRSNDTRARGILAAASEFAGDGGDAPRRAGQSQRGVSASPDGLQ